MAYGHAVLGESLELCKEAAEWGKNEQKRLEKNESAKKKVREALEKISFTSSEVETRKREI